MQYKINTPNDWQGQSRESVTLVIGSDISAHQSELSFWLKTETPEASQSALGVA